jgi:CHAT domain-containing protein
LLVNGGTNPIVLDAATVESWPMPHLRLAVLSACSTGQGRMEGAESVAQAFLSAGARDVVATRWDVDSATSAAMMQQFYDFLLSGHGIAEALAMAEAKIRERTPQPYYWAAFEDFEK